MALMTRVPHRGRCIPPHQGMRLRRRTQGFNPLPGTTLTNQYPFHTSPPHQTTSTTTTSHPRSTLRSQVRLKLDLCALATLCC